MNDPEPSLVIRGDDEDFLEIVVGHPTQSDTDDYWDANWISAGIRMEVGAFRAHVAASLRREDFPPLRDGLKELNVSLSGQVRFTTIEEWLEIEITGDGRGHLAARGYVVEEPGGRNRLEFELKFDQTQLPRLIAELDAIVAYRPVIGSP